MLLALLGCTSPASETGVSAVDTGVTDTAAAAHLDCTAPVWREEDVLLSRQSEVDGFCSQWNAVRGDLRIDVGATEDIITELDGLACLCEVDGDLVVYADDLPPSAPPALPPPHVTGDLELSLLTRIGGDFELRNLQQLTYLQEMWSLESIGGDLTIDGCPDLQYSALDALASVGGTITLHNLGQFLVFRMPSLATAGGLSLGAPGDAESLYFLAELDISSLTTLSGSLSITGARNLGLLSAPVLTDITGALHIEAACHLRPSMPALTAAGSLHIEGACGITDFAGLPALTTLTGTDAEGHSLWLSANEGLDSSEIDAFIGGLSQTPAGTIHTDTITTCDAILSDYTVGGVGFCD